MEQRIPIATDPTPSVPSALDWVEARLLDLGGELRPRGGDNSFAPVRHIFTPGLYAREIFMPAGAIITSAVHKTEHPYVVSAGRCLVYLENEARSVIIQAPHTGVTKPGTRRLLIIVEDTTWTTFHVTSKTSVEEIEEEILQVNRNPLLSEAVLAKIHAKDCAKEIA
jgi:hypothetical protein